MKSLTFDEETASEVEKVASQEESKVNQEANEKSIEDLRALRDTVQDLEFRLGVAEDKIIQLEGNPSRHMRGIILPPNRS